MHKQADYILRTAISILLKEVHVSGLFKRRENVK